METVKNFISSPPHHHITTSTIDDCEEQPTTVEERQRKKIQEPVATSLFLCLSMVSDTVSEYWNSTYF